MRALFLFLVQLEARIELARAKRRLVLPYPELQRRILSRRVPDRLFGRRRWQTIRRLRGALHRVTRRFRERPTCFVQALALLTMLRRRGIEPALHYGARSLLSPSPGEPAGLEGHVWLADGERGIIGRRVAADFRALARLNPVPDVPGLVIVLLGVARSGTSLATAGLQALGVSLGPRLRGGSAANPTGLFEDADVVAINRALLRRAGTSPFTLRPPAPGRWDAPEFDDLRHAARAVVAQRLASGGAWAFKDPRTVVTLPFWQKVLTGCGVEVRFLVVVRHPVAVAVSLQRAFRVPVRRGTRVWLAGVAAILAGVSRRPWGLVDYERLLREPAGSLGEVADVLGLPVGNDAADRIDAFARSFVDPSLCHFPPEALRCRGWEGRAAARFHAWVASGQAFPDRMAWVERSGVALHQLLGVISRVAFRSRVREG